MLFPLLGWSQIPYPPAPSFTHSSNQNKSNQAILHQQNRQAMEAMGITPPPTKEEILTKKYTPYISRQQKTFKMIQELKNEWTVPTNTIRSAHVPLENFETPEWHNKTAAFNKAYDELTHMLEEESNYDFKRALFIVENAYFDNIMDYNKYLDDLKASAQTIAQYVIQKDKNPQNPYDLQWGLLDYLSDTLFIKVNGTEQTTIHYPQQYDFNDFMGIENYTNTFVVKVMQTNTGNCRSMPRRGKAIGELLGVDLKLANAPNHSYLMYQDEEGNYYNFEATHGISISDARVMRGNKISSKAVFTKTYMAPLNKRQDIAECLLDLAEAFEVKYGVADGKFILKCLEKAIEQYPDNENSIRAQMMFYNLYRVQLEQIGNRSNSATEEELLKLPEAKALYTKMINTDDKLTDLGYIEMSQHEYEAWLKEIEREKEKRASNNFIFRSITR